MTLTKAVFLLDDAVEKPIPWIVLSFSSTTNERRIGFGKILHEKSAADVNYDIRSTSSQIIWPIWLFWRPV
jgi:hypothetical protein